MPGVVRSLLAALMFSPMAIHAEVDGHALLKFQQAAEAFNAQLPDAHRYRAGYYYGYLSGVLEALNGKSVCFNECRCVLDALIGRHYAQHPEDLDKPAGPTLARLFEQHFPCKMHDQPQ